MKDTTLKLRAKSYLDPFHEGRDINELTLAGFIRALNMEESDWEMYSKDSRSRKVLLDIFLEFAELFEIECNKDPRKRKLLEALNKFTGNLYDANVLAKDNIKKTQQALSGVSADSRKRLIEIVSERYGRDNDERTDGHTD